MKNRVIAIFCIIILTVISIISHYIYVKEKNISRYEQHIEKVNIGDKGSISKNNLVSHLPIISITTNNQKIPGRSLHDKAGLFKGYETGDNGETQIKVEIKIFDNKDSQNSITDKANINSEALFRIRGKTSRSFDKKSYKIKFIDNQENETNYEVMGMSKASEWALNGPYLDKTLLRNYMWMNISANIMGYAPNVRFCECYLDDKYQGLYLMMETIEKGINRVNIRNYDSNDRVIPYIVKMDKQDLGATNNINSFSLYTSHLDYSTGFSIIYPNATKLDDNIKQYIENDISAFEKALYSYDFKNSKKGYEKYIDVDSWIDYYIIQEFLANSDMCSFSTYMYKDKGGKLTMGPVWDFNNVCDNYTISEYKPEGFYFTTNRIWYEMLFKDKKFVKRVQKRYKELRKTYLNENYLINYIDETVQYLGDAVNRNFEVWGYTFNRENQKSTLQYLQPVERNPKNYDEAIKKYKDFIIQRGSWMDSNIETLNQYCHTSRNKLYVE